MRVVVVYRDMSDHGRAVTDFLRDFKSQTGKEVSGVDPDSPEGIDMCNAYDVVEYPTMLALADDGHMLNMWRGIPLPTISEVSFYA